PESFHFPTVGSGIRPDLLTLRGKPCRRSRARGAPWAHPPTAGGESHPAPKTFLVVAAGTGRGAILAHGSVGPEATCGRSVAAMAQDRVDHAGGARGAGETRRASCRDSGA